MLGRQAQIAVWWSCLLKPYKFCLTNNMVTHIQLKNHDSENTQTAHASGQKKLQKSSSNARTKDICLSVLMSWQLIERMNLCIGVFSMMLSSRLCSVDRTVFGRQTNRRIGVRMPGTQVIQDLVQFIRPVLAFLS